MLNFEVISLPAFHTHTTTFIFKYSPLKADVTLYSHAYTLPPLKFVEAIT